MSSRTPYIDMEKAFWTYLNKQKAYQDLRLNEFRGYDGRLMPFDPKKGLFPAEKLPAIYAMQSALGTKTANEQQVVDAIELKGRLVFAADGSPPDRGPIERAFVTISDILGTLVAQTSRLDSGAVIESYEWKPDSPFPAPNLAEGLARFWIWDWSIVLTGKRHTVLV